MPATACCVSHDYTCRNDTTTAFRHFRHIRGTLYSYALVALNSAPVLGNHIVISPMMPRLTSQAVS